jgi:pyridoxal phosphate enzyme (YggS family)
MDIAFETLSDRLARVRRRIAEAAARAGRDPAAVTLVLVTKEAPESIFALARRAGLREIGESRVQQAEQRHEGRADDFRWHLIGHLQANKARRAVRVFDVLHGVDSAALLQRVDAAAAAFDRRPEVLLQVNVSGEASKHGLSPGELPAALEAAARLKCARVTGLMTMAPAADDPGLARGCFRELARLRERHARLPGGGDLVRLSMGMSDDFEVAVEEGATLVRIGRLLVAPDGLTSPSERALPR